MPRKLHVSGRWVSSLIVTAGQETTFELRAPHRELRAPETDSGHPPPVTISPMRNTQISLLKTHQCCWETRLCSHDWTLGISDIFCVFPSILHPSTPPFRLLPSPSPSIILLLSLLLSINFYSSLTLLPAFPPHPSIHLSYPSILPSITHPSMICPQSIQVVLR